VIDISTHITWKEATHSETAESLGINNEPGKSALKAMQYVANNVFEPARNHFGKPIRVSSFFRCRELNKAIGGSKSSQHVHGEAIDMVAIGFTNKELFDFIRQRGIFDQLIAEFPDENEEPKWVHVSLKMQNNRKQVMYSAKINGKTVYYNV